MKWLPEEPEDWFGFLALMVINPFLALLPIAIVFVVLTALMLLVIAILDTTMETELRIFIIVSVGLPMFLTIATIRLFGMYGAQKRAQDMDQRRKEIKKIVGGIATNTPIPSARTGPGDKNWQGTNFEYNESDGSFRCIACNAKPELVGAFTISSTRRKTYKLTCLKCDTSTLVTVDFDEDNTVVWIVFEDEL